MLQLIFSTLKPLMLLFNSFWLTNIEFKIQCCWLMVTIWLPLFENGPQDELVESGNEGKEDKRKDSKVVLSCDLLVYELQVLWHPNFR